MADLQTLNIVIGANTQQATAGLNAVSESLANTAIAAQKVDSTIAKSTTNFTGLNRVLQDLPFGFIAISNNLEQLLPAAGLLGTAFSAIIATVTFLQIGFRNWTRGVKDNTEALGRSAEEAKKFYDSAGKEIANLTVLTNAAKDNGLAMEVRLNAVKELQKEYPQYFANLSKEQILQGDVGAAINETTKALFAQAVVREKTSDLGPLAAQIFDLKQQREELEKQEAVMKRMNAITGATRDPKTGILGRLYGAGSQDRKGLSDLAAQIEAIDVQLSPLQGKFKGIAQAIIDASKEAGTGLFAPGKETKGKLAKVLSDYFAVDTNIKDIPKKFIDAIAIDTGDHINQTINKALDKGPGIVVKPKVDFDVLEYQINNISDILGQTLKPAIDSVFAAFANGQNAFDALGQAIKSIITKLAAAVLEAAIFSLIINAITGGVASFAGFGKILSALSGLPKFAAGGVVTRPTLLIAGEQGPEKITPLNQINNGGNAMIGGEFQLRVRGQDLWAVLNRYNKTAYNTF